MSASTGFDIERATLATAFMAGFKGNDGNSPFPVVVENQPAPSVKGVAWGRFSVRPGTVDAAEIGIEMRRNPGVLYLQMFLPQNSGTKLAHQAANLLSNTFDYVTLSLPDDAGLIRCDCVSLTNVGIDATSGLMQVNASVEYTRDVFVLAPLTYAQLCVAAAWRTAGRSLHAGAPDVPSTEAERYAAAIWSFRPRTLTLPGTNVALSLVQTLAVVAWAHPSRSLGLGVPIVPSTDLQRYAAAIWSRRPRTLSN